MVASSGRAHRRPLPDHLLGVVEHAACAVRAALDADARVACRELHITRSYPYACISTCSENYQAPHLSNFGVQVKRVRVPQSPRRASQCVGGVRPGGRIVDSPRSTPGLWKQ